MAPRVGIVTVTYNSADVLQDFLVSVASQTLPDIHLYVVDNASTDSTIKALARHGSAAITVIENSVNTGIAVGNNQGTAQALADGCDWILYLNNDTFFSPKVIEDLIRTAEDTGAPLLSPVIAATEPAGTDWYSDGVIWPWKAMRAKHLGMGKPLNDDRPRIYPVRYASTCALLVRRDVVEQVGPMDSRFFVYGDDVDFCLRVQAAGFRYAVAGQVVVTHKASSLTGEFTGDFALRWITRNWVLVGRKHCTRAQFLVGMAYILVWITARLLARREQFSMTRKRLRAVREGLSVDLSPGSESKVAWLPPS